MYLFFLYSYFCGFLSLYLNLQLLLYYSCLHYQFCFLYHLTYFLQSFRPLFSLLVLFHLQSFHLLFSQYLTYQFLSCYLQSSHLLSSHLQYFCLTSFCLLCFYLLFFYFLSSVFLSSTFVSYPRFSPIYSMSFCSSKKNLSATIP